MPSGRRLMEICPQTLKLLTTDIRTLISSKLGERWKTIIQKLKCRWKSRHVAPRCDDVRKLWGAGGNLHRDRLKEHELLVHADGVGASCHVLQPERTIFFGSYCKEQNSAVRHAVTGPWNQCLDAGVLLTRPSTGSNLWSDCWWIPRHQALLHPPGCWELGPSQKSPWRGIWAAPSTRVALTFQHSGASKPRSIGVPNSLPPASSCCVPLWNPS